MIASATVSFFTKPALKLPIRSVYTLTSAYRI
jgi:hypothetical protein